MGQSYTINIGDFSREGVIYLNRCLSASIGGNGIQSGAIPWENTEYNPWDYKYENGRFVLDQINIHEPITSPTEIERIRADVDYPLMLEE